MIDAYLKGQQAAQADLQVCRKLSGEAHDLEKCAAIFQKIMRKQKFESATTIHPDLIALWGHQPAPSATAIL
jgi:hypothetical protein